MVKGAQKRMVVLRTSGSDLYEQAYFVLRDSRTQSAPDERSMIVEANRILNENLLPSKPKREKTRVAWWLLLGALLGAALASALWLLLLH